MCNDLAAVVNIRPKRYENDLARTTGLHLLSCIELSLIRMDSNVSDYNSGIRFVEDFLLENDVKGAIDFAKRVQTSSRKLKRLSRFLANIVVRVSSEDEEKDWYSVLGVDPSADPQTMKKVCVRLSKSIRLTGLREAHRLLNKAWATLSDKFTRKDYDLRRRSRELQQNALAVTHASSADENVSQALSNVDNAVVSNQKSSNTNCSIGGSDQRDDFADRREISAMNWESIWNPEANYDPHEPLYTFSTACPSCHYESLRVCLISKADCLQCGKAFAAVDDPSPDAKHKENVPENHMPLGGDGWSERSVPLSEEKLWGRKGRFI